MNDLPPVRPRMLVPTLLTLVGLNLLLLARLVWPLLDQPAQPYPVMAAAGSSTPSPVPDTATPVPPVYPTLPPEALAQAGLRQQGVFIFSMRDGHYFHLFAYNPQFLPLTRLTTSEWDDITPSVSPDGKRIAYASRKSGFWDLYLLDLNTGQSTQLTDTPDYDGKPTWSPDGEWLAYESYHNGNLDIFLLSISDLSQAPIQLTDDPAADDSPAWSSQGRQLAYVSTRTGEEEIWLARLDSVEDRFTNVSDNSGARQTHPAWSPDGRYLSWTAQSGGFSTLQVWDSQNPDQQPLPAGNGEEAVWGPDSRRLLARIITPNENGLSGYDAASGQLVMPFLTLPGDLRGMDWRAGDFILNLAPLIAKGSSATTQPLYQPTQSRLSLESDKRFRVVALNDVQAPYPMLADPVDEAFAALREDVARQTGWDFLGNLENAFIPLTQPSEPGMKENWLYSGRSFSANPLLFNAGWMLVVREDINGQTFWRVYLKARYQDGSQGLPMTARPWDLDARYSGDPRYYEQGGQLAPVPAGYWIDFTELAGRYGWERLPALVSWISYYPAARFNQFVLSGGLDWWSAMRQLYPPEALKTGTSVPTPTITPSPIPTGRNGLPLPTSTRSSSGP